MSVPGSFEALAQGLAARRPAPHGLTLQLEELSLRVRTDNEAIAQDLRGYFAHFVAETGEGSPADLEFLFLDGPVEEPPLALATRPHLPGKRPDKERSADLPLAEGQGVGRIVRKQATGMLFLFGGGVNIALGPCAQNRNQLVNFLCARYMERRVAGGWALGHAAGVALSEGGPDGGPGLALCGFAGMGKSTLALHLVAKGLDFVSNDRVLVEPARERGESPRLHGIPKHPRLNPGTALGNAALAPLLSCALPEALLQRYADAPRESLYAVEDKYDALIGQCFGPVGGGFRLAAGLAGVVVLNWKHGGGPMRATAVDLSRRPDLLSALRKPPGVFYLPQALHGARLSPDDTLAALCGAPALELSGGSDFAAATDACLEFLHQHRAKGRPL